MIRINRQILKFSLLVSIVLLFTANLMSQPAGMDKSSANSAVPLITLKGNAYEKGLQHGRELKKQISDVFEKWKANIQLAIKGNPDSVLTAFLKATNFEPAILKYTPDLLEEVKGIAEGSGQKFSDVFAFQLLDEFWVYLDQQFNLKNHHCSGMGVPASGGHPAYIAQNTDLEGYMHGYQVLFHVEATKKEPEQYILSCAGLIAINGMNGKGIGVCVNTLMELRASGEGLPVAFILRGILSRQKPKEVLSFLTTLPHASGQNYIVGIEDSVYDFEASSTQVVRFFPKGGQQSVVYHTNHALANHDVKDWYKIYHDRVLAGQTRHMNSEARFAALETYLNKTPGEISQDNIKTALRSKDNPANPVCRPYNGGAGFTFSSVIFTLGGKRSVQLTYGSPDQSVYKEYFFKASKAN